MSVTVVKKNSQEGVFQLEGGWELVRAGGEAGCISAEAALT